MLKQINEIAYASLCTTKQQESYNTIQYKYTTHIDIPPWETTSPQMASKVHKSIKRSQSESIQVTS